MSARAVAKAEPTIVFDKAQAWWSFERVRLWHVARRGDLVRYRDEDRIVDGDVYQLEAGRGTEKCIRLADGELSEVATEFFVFFDAGTDGLSEIRISVDGGTFGMREIRIPKHSFARVAEALAPYRRAPLAAAGAYR